MHDAMPDGGRLLATQMDFHPVDQVLQYRFVSGLSFERPLFFGDGSAVCVVDFIESRATKLRSANPFYKILSHLRCRHNLI